MIIDKPGEYKMRNGEKAIVYSVNSQNADYPVFGEVENDNLASERWTRDGFILRHKDDPLDIVGPWKEPLRLECEVKWATMDYNSAYPKTLCFPIGNFPKFLNGKKGKLIFIEEIK